MQEDWDYVSYIYVNLGLAGEIATPKMGQLVEGCIG